MLLIMVVNLYTSRVILQALGVEDFGLYNVVGGVVVLFTFINNAMVTSTQRFLNFEIGRNDIEEAQKVFSASLNIHFLIAGIFFLLAETIGLWFLNKYIQIPDSREIAANWAYQFSVFVSILNIIRSPYNAAIIAHEHMSFYAYVSIIEAILKLSIVYLIYLFADRLIAYALLMMIVSLIILSSYYIYCKRKFVICKYKFKYDRKRYISLASFSGWSLFGSMANVGASQGLNIILNMFFGVTVNAALGIANQVNSAVYQFVSSFQTAFNPPIVKSYASEDFYRFRELISYTSRYSFFLLFIIAFPLLVNCDVILQIWLKDVPQYSAIFSSIIIMGSLFDALSGPLWMSVYASGQLKQYQIVISIILLSTVLWGIIVAILLKNPIYVIIVKLIVNIIIYIYRLLYCTKHYNISFEAYFRTVLLKCIIVSVLSIISTYLVINIFKIEDHTFLKMIIPFLCSIILIYGLGITRREREYIPKFLYNKLLNKFR